MQGIVHGPAGWVGDTPKAPRGFGSSSEGIVCCRQWDAAHLTQGAEITVLPSLVESNLRAWSASPKRYTVVRDGSTCTLEERGRVAARFEYDEEGFLKAWSIPGEQDFERVARKRLYYWNHTGPGDERLLEGR